MTKVDAIHFRCDICGTRFTNQFEAGLCEQHGVSLPRFVSGDVVRLHPDAFLAQGIVAADALVDGRVFMDGLPPTHDYAVRGHGVRYRVRIRGGRHVLVEANALLLGPGDLIFCRSWSEFVRTADTGRSCDQEGLDALKHTLNQKLRLGL